MRLLIIDDDAQLAEITAQLLQCVDLPTHCIEEITLAGDLETALGVLPEHDAVLCDAQFPVSADSRSASEAWNVVLREAARHSIHFVLYSGCARALDDAYSCDIPAITKPAPIEEIYAVLTEQVLEGCSATTTHSQAA